MAEIAVPYEYDGSQFEGLLVYDDSVAEKRPGIFVQPDWLGVCSHTVDMAVDAGGSDYVMMVADMYGVGYGEREKPTTNCWRVPLECAATCRSFLAAAPKPSRR